jgi:hypothetical protein
MKRYKFTDSKNDVVHQIDEDGKSRMSCAIDHFEYTEWLANGGVTEDSDPEPTPAPAPTLVEQILASPADLAALKKALGL